MKAGEPLILENLNFEVSSGSWVALTGPSGVGKTTLLSLCAGLLSPTAGIVELFGHRLGDMEDERVSRLRSESVGLVFQGYHLDDSRSTLDNILLPGYFGNHPWHQLKTEAMELALALELEPQLEKPVAALSGGQRQRVATARALVTSPTLLLADEPTGALDEATAQLVLDLLASRVERGLTIVSVTHDPKVLARADANHRFVDRSLEKVTS